MGKRPKKGDDKITKKTLDLNAYRKNERLAVSQEDKEDSRIKLSPAWHDATKLPGFPRGFVSLVRGFSNNGKSTAFYEAIAGAQRCGDLAVVIETEGNWNWKHAKQVGVKFEEIIDEETGEIVDGVPENVLLYRNHNLYEKYKLWDHQNSKKLSKSPRNEPVIEDVSLLINELLAEQASGELPYNLCFLWDSIGTLNCYKSALSNTSNNMWNAGAMNCFQSIVNVKIPGSRITSSEYTNTLICVQKIWLDNMNGTVIKHKGGEMMFFNSRIIVHLGGILTHGTKKLKATALKQEYQYGTEAKINVVKNHITGIERAGKICSTPHGYVNPDELDEYKTEHRKFIHEALNVPYDTVIDFTEEEVLKVTEDDIKE